MTNTRKYNTKNRYTNKTKTKKNNTNKSYKFWDLDINSSYDKLLYAFRHFVKENDPETYHVYLDLLLEKFITELKDEKYKVIELPNVDLNGDRHKNYLTAWLETLKAIKQEPDYIYQGVLYTGDFLGYVDFCFCNQFVLIYLFFNIKNIY